MENLIIIAILFIIIISATVYIDKRRKKGVKCIGCPYALECAESRKNSACTCNTK